MTLVLHDNHIDICVINTATTSQDVIYFESSNKVKYTLLVH